MERAESHFREVLAERLAATPDPAQAATLAANVLAAIPEDEARALAEAAPELAADALAVLCGVAPFFASFLQRHPEWLGRLVSEDLDQPLAQETLAARLTEQLRPGEEAERALRCFKYYELARITLRDCSPGRLSLAQSGETLREVSQLADVLLARSLEEAARRVEERLGPPQWQFSGEAAPGEATTPKNLAPREVALRFAVIALGKLGGEELNFSSDVDLIYIYETPPDGTTPAPSKTSPVEYFTRLAQTFGALVSENTSDGFLYRVDVDLRPAGAQGALVISQETLESYYELWADTWEKATFTKARPVAGDLALGWRAVRAVAPMTYLSSMDYAAVQGIRELKEKFEQAKGGHDKGFNVKLDPGGIREVEFIAQAMQLLHGARIPQIRCRGTMEALEQLARVGLIPEETVDVLRDDYLFLRRVENRLQMEAERQVHRVPFDPQRAERLARAMEFCGKDAQSEFEAELAQRRDRVHAAYAAVLAQGGAESGAERVFDLFARGTPRLVAFPATRRMLERLAELFAREIDSSSDPERALNGLDRFIHGIGARTFYYELLLDRPELVPRLAALFGASKFLSSYLASHPRLIEPLFHDPDRLLPTRANLEEDWAAFRSAFAADPANAERDPTELQLDALRIFHHRETLNVGLLDITPRPLSSSEGASLPLITRAEIEGALSELAEVCLGEALDLALQQLAESRGAKDDMTGAEYIVVAMGKLATCELAYGSDLDLIFLFDSPGGDGARDLAAQEYFVRVSQRLISILQTPTSEGFCYEIDARLRPSGNQGALVTSLTAFEKYHADAAQGWERQALLRARSTAGDAKLTAAFETLRREILTAPRQEDLAAEIHHIRNRMEVEIAKETGTKRNFKTGRGGVLDVESIVQYLQLTHGQAHPELLDVRRTEEHLTELAHHGLLEEADAEALRSGWEFLCRLSNRLRIVDNRSISDLDDERGDLESLAIRVGYPQSTRQGKARRALLTDYRHHTTQIRTLYNKILTP